MKKSLLISTITGVTLSLLLANGALAGHKHHHKHQYRHTGYDHRGHGDYARVVEARPIYQRIEAQVPQQSCHYETVAYREPGRSNSYTGAVVGGLIGAAVGHELGHSKRNKDVGAVAGGLLGATIGHDISRNRSGGGTTHYRDEQVCHTRYQTEYSQRVVGYDVTYQYHGPYYQTRTSQHPGDRIPVDVNVRPGRGY